MGIARRSEPSDRVILATTDHVVHWHIVAREGINTLQDLKGKRIGYSGVGACSHYIGLLLAQRMGWDPDQDIALLGGDYSVNPLKKGWVDAFIAYEVPFSIALLPNVLAAQKAVEEGAFEAVFVTSEGIVHEGARSNIFMVADNRVYTPPKTENLLAGITREVVLQCAQDVGCEVYEETLRIGALLQADEVFLTSTTIQILGVIEVDGKTISNGMVGPVTRRLSDVFLSTLQDLNGCDAFARPAR